ncbi:MAG: T9SS type A sorting domain-containing protein [Paludibacteraceae bacterium]
MKKNTLILFVVILSALTLSAQKNTSLFDKNSTESAYQQSDKVADNSNTPKFSIVGKSLIINNIEQGVTIEIYSALGAKVLSIVYGGNPLSLTELKKGIYIVKAGKLTQKIMI